MEETKQPQNERTPAGDEVVFKREATDAKQSVEMLDRTLQLESDKKMELIHQQSEQLAGLAP